LHWPERDYSVIRHLAFTGLAILALGGCHGARAPEEFGPLAEEFVYSTLEFSPVSPRPPPGCTSAPARTWTRCSTISARKRSRRSALLPRLPGAAAKLNSAAWGCRDRVDYGIVLDQIERGRSWSWTHPKLPAQPYPVVDIRRERDVLALRPDTPAPVRMRHIVARLEKLPAFLLPQAATCRIRRHLDPGRPRRERRQHRSDRPHHSRRRSQRVARRLRSRGARLWRPCAPFAGWLKSDLKPASEDAWRLGRTTTGRSSAGAGTQRTPDQCWQRRRRTSAPCGAVLELAGRSTGTGFPSTARTPTPVPLLLD